jgi:glycosyltransferase involved in cell wall biosynthesis
MEGDGVNEMKRILLLIKGLGGGGAEQLLVGAAPYLNTEKFEYEVAYIVPRKDELVHSLANHGLVVHCLGGARGSGWVGRLRDLVHANGIDLVHAHSPYPAVGARLAFRKGPRLVYTEHGVWDYYHPATRWANLLTFRTNDHVFAVSRYVQDSMRYPRPVKFLPMPPVEVLYHGIDLALLEQQASRDGVRGELGIPDHVPIIGTVANFRAQKRHDLLLRAARIVTRTYPEARFVLVGQGPLEAQTRRQVGELGLERNVIFAGFREDVARLVSAFDLFLLTSEYEGLSIALLEAMALGKPTVVTRVGGILEVVVHDRSGIIAPLNDANAVAAGVAALLDDEGLRTRLGHGARERAAEFDIQRAVRRQEEVYGQLLG